MTCDPGHGRRDTNLYWKQQKMKPIKLFCLILVLMFIAVGCKKEPTEPSEPPQQAAAEHEEKPAKPTELTKSFHQAASDGEIEQVKLHISKGTDINVKDKHGFTPLHRAAQKGHKDIAKLLIAKGADIHAKVRGFTPLQLAATNGHKEIVELLIAKGAQPDICAASALGDVGCVAALLKEDPTLVNTMWGNFTPLHWAVLKDHNAVAELLIAKGANINAKDRHGETPLYIAAARGRTAVAELLVAKGAQIDIFTASALGNVDRVMTFLKADPNVANARGPGDFTPLYCAAACGQRSVAEILIAKGAKVDAKCHTGATPLCGAVWLDHRATAELLIDKGADVNIRVTRLGDFTALHTAAAKGYTAMVKLLIDRGADVNAKNEKGQTPLHWAILGGHKAMTEVLLAKGADINAKDKEGQTFLTLAKKKSHKEIVELLRKHGAKE